MRQTWLKVNTPISFTLALALSGCAAKPETPPPNVHSPLQSADQKQFESEALHLFKSKPMIAARAAAVEVLAAQPDSGEPAQIMGAADELAFGAIESVVNADPARPKILNLWDPPHPSFKRQLPGAKALIPNPDTVFRIIPIDEVSSYVIEARPVGAKPAQQVFMLQNDLNDSGPGLQVFGLRVATDFVKAADGAFTLVIDPAPSSAPNHFRSGPGTKVLLIRDTLSDWTTQLPYALTVRRISGPDAAAPLTEAALANKAAAALKELVPMFIRGRKAFFTTFANLLPAPHMREAGGWALSAGGHFELADDEALVVTVSSLSAKYLAVQLADPWTRALDYEHHTASLNNDQAVVNADGTYTFVISTQDPGVQNWVDTCGGHEGVIFIRWQNLQGGLDPSAAIRNVHVVHLADLDLSLPEGTAKIDAATRKQLLQARAAAYLRRFGE